MLELGYLEKEILQLGVTHIALLDVAGGSIRRGNRNRRCNSEIGTRAG